MKFQPGRKGLMSSIFGDRQGIFRGSRSTCSKGVYSDAPAAVLPRPVAALDASHLSHGQKALIEEILDVNLSL